MTTQDKGLIAPGTVIAASQNFDIDTPYGRGIRLNLKTTAEDGTSTLDMKLQSYDGAGNYIDIPGASIAQMTGVGTSTLTVYPGIAETANVSVSDCISRRTRVVLTLGGTNYTGSLTANILI